MSGLTTAAALVAYRTELTEGGFSENLVDELVRDAAAVIVREGGLGVRND